MPTIKLNLLQGLRYKKRIKEAISRVTANIKTYNSKLQDTEDEIDVRKAIAFRTQLKEILVDLKLKLQDASRPIQRDILMLSELKDELGFYQSLETKHGKEHSFNYGEHQEMLYQAIVRKAEVDQKCMELQKELDNLYAKVDAFNTAHFVETEEITAEMLAAIAK